jgi:hypothetical protein
MQLDFVPQLFEKDTRATRAIDEGLRVARNLKYLRAKIDVLEAIISNNKKKAELRIAQIQLDNTLYMFGMLLYKLSSFSSKYKSWDKDTFDSRIQFKGIHSLSEPLSPLDLYNLSQKTKSSLKVFILSHWKHLKLSPVIDRLFSIVTDSIDETTKTLKNVI